MSASQAHGFQLEDAIRSAIYPGARKLVYNHPWDVEVGHSDWSALHPSQIKCATARSSAAPASAVMLGDALRNYDRTGPFEMVVADLAQNGGEKIARRYLRLAFAPDAFRLALFGSLTRIELEAIDSLVKSVPLGDDPVARKYVHQHCEATEARAGMSGDLQAKMSRTDGQRRLQVSCTQETLLLAASKAHEIKPEEFEALGLPASIKSERRARKKKAQAEAETATATATATESGS